MIKNLKESLKKIENQLIQLNNNNRLNLFISNKLGSKNVKFLNSLNWSFYFILGVLIIELLYMTKFIEIMAVSFSIIGIFIYLIPLAIANYLFINAESPKNINSFFIYILSFITFIILFSIGLNESFKIVLINENLTKVTNVIVITLLLGVSFRIIKYLKDNFQKAKKISEMIYNAFEGLINKTIILMPIIFLINQILNPNTNLFNEIFKITIDFIPYVSPFIFLMAIIEYILVKNVSL
jgi:hypothetical protein